MVVMVCRECGREFDPCNRVDRDEWLYGHDCEVNDAAAGGLL